MNRQHALARALEHAMASGVCDRCRRPVGDGEWDGLGEWNVIFSLGHITGFMCPDCQTDYENAEAEINAATTDYSRARRDEDGRWRA